MKEYIEREALIDSLDGLCDRVCQYSKKQRAAMCGACPLGHAFDLVEEFPAADVEPVRHGRWVLTTEDDGYGEYQIYKCDKCGAITAQRKNYCPDCGAKMEVDDAL